MDVLKIHTLIKTLHRKCKYEQQNNLFLHKSQPKLCILYIMKMKQCGWGYILWQYSGQFFFQLGLVGQHKLYTSYCKFDIADILQCVRFFLFTLKVTMAAVMWCGPAYYSTEDSYSCMCFCMCAFMCFICQEPGQSCLL